LARIRIGTLRMGDMRLGDARALSAAERGQLERLVLDDTRATPDEKHGLVVSIDGPGGSGKSTVGERAAEALGYRFCDTGVLYRGLTWLAMQRGVDVDDASSLVALVPHIQLEPDARLQYVRLI